ncbi:hypothetical protein [Aporhodopirellula aestuarii]|uniref:Uncharacterized protein n=1 Tax=Aporhodopirellula aestuarii TaxID=2950107 RepID=A0ABT0UCA6_9BACT|nr:hypothetical protein [Aporhodopirellula aestuarii]MCM2374523.1 hypothetical protein [Aporhodopirellula aestuarii]
MHRLGQTLGTSLRCDCGATLFVSLQGRLVTAIDNQRPELDDSAVPIRDDATTDDDAPLDDDAPNRDDALSDDDAPNLDDEPSGDDEPTTSPIITLDTEDKAPKKRKNKDAKKRDEKADEERPSRRNRKKNSWPLIAGAGFVALLLLTSITMFLLQSTGGDQSQSARDRSNAAKQKQAAAPPKKAVIKPGTLKNLVAQVPTPLFAQPTANVLGATEKNTSATQTKKPIASAPAESERSPYGGQTQAPVTSLPERVEPRQRIPLIEPAKSSNYFDEAYNVAYQNYEAWAELGDKATDSEEYQTKLGETLGAVKVAYGLSLRRDNLEKRNELLYLLAFLSLKAGHLMEAAIYGETAARLGDPEESATRDAAFIALAAVQEASSNHWGIPEEVGELRFMETIAQLIETKWPDDPQRDQLWFTLGQLYAAFEHPKLAVDAYSHVGKDSDAYVDAKIASGVAYWSIFLTEASHRDADPDAMLDLLKKSSDEFRAAVTAMEADLKKPTMRLLTAKQMLAVIADRTGDTTDVIRWTTKGKFPVVGSIRVKKTGNPKTIVVPAAFAQTIFQLVYKAQTAEGDLQGAQKSLETLDVMLGKQSGSQVQSMQYATAIRRFKEVLAQDTVSMSDVKMLDETLAKTPPNSTAAGLQDQLWMAQSWATLAEKAPNDDLARKCYERAAKSCETILSAKTLPQNMLAPTQVRQAEWLRLAGKTEASLAVISQILETTPNVFDLQRQAALTLEELAIQNDSEDKLRAAIQSSKDQPSIWGWSKLAVNLHRLRYSERGTEQHAMSLLEAHFHLARCRWMLAQVVDSDSERASLEKQTLKQIASARLAIPEGSEAENKWLDTFNKLETVVSGSK